MAANVLSRSVPVALLALVLCLLAAAVPAAPVGGPCAETIEKSCRDVTPGSGRIAKCLNDHAGDQSIACKEWVADQTRSLKDLNRVCDQEIVRMCGSVPAEGVRIFQCLEENYINLRIDCREKMREFRDRLQ